MVLDAERLAGGGQLLDAVRAELVVLVGGEVAQLGHDDLALLAERAGDQGDEGVLARVARHGAAGAR